jgi:hypothetical protein
MPALVAQYLFSRVANKLASRNVSSPGDILIGKELPMSVSLLGFRIGEPLRHEALSVFPLFSDSAGQAQYLIAEEALAGGLAIVEEISEAGSVPELLVDNRSDLRLLLLEGEELRGAKQNRILNTTVLVPARSKVRIPVSCVEQRRWRYSGRHFESSGHHATAKLRSALKASVSESLLCERGHRSDQRQVWDEVESLHLCMRVASETSAMSDAFELYQDQISGYRDQLKYVDGASGLAVAIGGRGQCRFLRSASDLRAGMGKVAIRDGA